MARIAERMIVTLSAENREVVQRLINELPDGARLEIKQPLRTLAQNRAMWPMLIDLSEQVEWHGKKLTPGDWKNVASASLRKCQVVPTFDEDGLVPLGLYTSEMGNEEFDALLELIRAFGAQQGVRWSAPRWVEKMRGPPIGEPVR